MLAASAPLRSRRRASSGVTADCSAISATTPVTCGAAMLVPDILTVPSPSRVERMPTLFRKQLLLMSSRSSPGADTLTPIPLSESNAPSVVKYDAVSLLTGLGCPPQALLPAVAVVLATAMTSGYVAGTWSLTCSVLSFPAATTTVMPAVTTACTETAPGGLRS